MLSGTEQGFSKMSCINTQHEYQNYIDLTYQAKEEVKAKRSKPKEIIINICLIRKYQVKEGGNSVQRRMTKSLLTRTPLIIDTMLIWGVLQTLPGIQESNPSKLS